MAMITPGSSPILMLRPRWALALQGSVASAVIVGAVLGVINRRWWLALGGAVLALAWTAMKVRRRSLSVDAQGFVAQRDSYRLFGRWADVTAVRRRRIGLVTVDELVLAASQTEPIGVNGKRRDAVPAKVAEVGADRRVQVGVYDRAWRSGPIGQALAERGIDLNT